MPTFVTIGYGDQAGHGRTDPSVRDAAHEHDERLRARGDAMGIAGQPVQVRNHYGTGVETGHGTGPALRPSDCWIRADPVPALEHAIGPPIPYSGLCRCSRRHRGVATQIDAVAVPHLRWPCSRVSRKLLARSRGDAQLTAIPCRNAAESHPHPVTVEAAPYGHALCRWRPFCSLAAGGGRQRIMNAQAKKEASTEEKAEARTVAYAKGACATTALRLELTAMGAGPWWSAGSAPAPKAPPSRRRRTRARRSCRTVVPRRRTTTIRDDLRPPRQDRSVYAPARHLRIPRPRTTRPSKLSPGEYRDDRSRRSDPAVPERPRPRSPGRQP